MRCFPRRSNSSASANAPCWLCGQSIGWGAEANTPDAFELDHVKPRKTHPWLLLDRGNCRPSHHRCNRSTGAGGAPASLDEPTEDWKARRTGVKLAG